MRKAIFVAVALFALLAVMTLASASDLGVTIDKVTVNGIDVTSGTVVSGIEAGDTIPVEVTFTADENASTARVKVWVEGNRDDIISKTPVFELVDGSTYTRRLSLKLPANIDLTEDFTLWVSISAQTEKKEVSYELKLQRQSYKLDVLSVDMPDTATAGSTVAVSLVLKNRGMISLEDVYAIIRIPDLKIAKRVYFGDVANQDNNDETNNMDSVERKVLLAIPNTAKAGVYDVEVQAYNYDVDADTLVKGNIAIVGNADLTDVVAGTSAKTLNVGEQTSFDLIIVNSGDRMQIFNLAPESADGLIIDVAPVVTVAPGSSTTVKVNVQATSSANVGTNNVVIDVTSDGQLVSKASFTANVAGQTSKMSNSVVVLTIVLAIVFIVLLIVLIVLLTRKPAMQTEEASYY